MTHTPLPWEAEGVDIYSPGDCDLHMVATCECNHTCRTDDEQAANADLIVRAVNNHEALLKALKEADFQFKLKGLHPKVHPRAMIRAALKAAQPD